VKESKRQTDHTTAILSVQGDRPRTSVQPQCFYAARFAFSLQTYLSNMPKSPFEHCIPTRATKVPDGKDWLRVSTWDYSCPAAGVRQ
jgi:hypothetical protein